MEAETVVKAPQSNVTDLLKRFKTRCSQLLGRPGFEAYFSAQPMVLYLLAPEQWDIHVSKLDPIIRPSYMESWSEFHAGLLAIQQLRIEMGLFPAPLARLTDAELGSAAMVALLRRQFEPAFLMMLPQEKNAFTCARQMTLGKKTKEVLKVNYVTQLGKSIGKSMFCANCLTMAEDEKEAKALKSCAMCARVCYCSRECQLENWPLHKLLCKQKIRRPKAQLDMY